MREIRFRAWDSQYNKMLPSVTIYADATSIGLTLEEAEKHYTEEQLDGTDNHLYGGDDWIFVMNEFELMQFTGLTDKNGKEIYESDVVEVEYGNGKVIFHAGCFMIEWISDPEANMELLAMRNAKFRHMREDLVVLGSIYENPELLNNL